MNDSAVVWLAIMAVSLAIVAVMQIALAIIAVRVGRQLTATTDALRRDVRPLIETTSRLMDEASRATSLAAAQVERVDRLLTTATLRVDETFSLVQTALAQPLRQGSALISGFRAALGVLRSFQGDRDRGRSRGPRDEEEALFVG